LQDFVDDLTDGQPGCLLMPGQQGDLSPSSAPGQGPERKTRGLRGAGRVTRESCDTKPDRHNLFRDAEVGKSLQHASWRPGCLHFIDHTMVGKALRHANPALARQIRRVDGLGAGQPVIEGKGYVERFREQGEHGQVRALPGGGGLVRVGDEYVEIGGQANEFIFLDDSVLAQYAELRPFSSESSSGGRMRRAADGNTHQSGAVLIP
jgi:hypothetical protein